MKVGEYKIIKIRGNLRIKQLMGVEFEQFVYALFKNNCIELRTKEQYELLLKRLDKKIQTSNDNSEVEKYKKYRTYVMGYSRILELYENHGVYFGVDIINRYNLKDGSIIEKCSDCIKIWNPNIFKVKQNEDSRKRYRR